MEDYGDPRLLFRVAPAIRWSVSLAVATLCLNSCGEPEPQADMPAPSATAAPISPEPQDEPVAPSDSLTRNTISENGWGPLEIGMTRAEVVAAAGEDANPDAVGGPEPEVCDQFRPEQAPEGLLVMVEDDRLTRVTISSGTAITTERGFGVGDLAAPIKEAYGADAVVSPHKYSPAPAEYITVWKTAPDAPEARGIVYEVGTDGRVGHIHAGSSSIQYVEGCL